MELEKELTGDTISTCFTKLNAAGKCNHVEDVAGYAAPMCRPCVGL
jgi:hypothetical protein